MFRKLVRVTTSSGGLVGVYQVQTKSRFRGAVFERMAIDIAIGFGDAAEETDLIAEVIQELEEPQPRMHTQAGVTPKARAKKPRFLRDPEVATEVGRKGGKAVKPENRMFYRSRELAARAGSLGGTKKAARNKAKDEQG